MSITLTSPDISSLSSFDLERYVAGIFQSLDYFTKRNLSWSENLISDSSRTVDILQVDLLSYFFSAFGENSILTECKGGGTFTDLFKFIGINNFLNPSSAFFVSNNTLNFNELHKIGKQQSVTVITPDNILSKFSSVTLKQKVDMWYWSNSLQDSLLEKSTIQNALNISIFSDLEKIAYSEIRKYNSKISNEIWIKSDPREQANCLGVLFLENKDFVRRILRILRLGNLDTENAISNHVMCESAASIVLKAKVDFIVIAVRCAINHLISTDENYLDTIEDENFKQVVTEMINSIQTACRLPNFLQFWIYQFGGMIDLNSIEKSIIAKYLGESESTIERCLEFLEKIFSIFTSFGTILWGMYNRNGILEFNAVPESIRGFGIYFREQNSIDITKFIYRQQWENRLKSLLALP